MKGSQLSETSDSLKSKPVTSAAPIGALIRDLRLSRGMTISDLAESIGRSIGYVSQVERDKSGVSIAALHRISDALSVEPKWFFQGQAVAPVDEHNTIVRKANRRTLDLSANGVVQDLLSPTMSGQMELMITTFQPGGKTGGRGRLRKGEETGFLMSGKLTLHVDGRSYELKAGDSYALHHKGRHIFENFGKKPAELVCAVLRQPDSSK